MVGLERFFNVILLVEKRVWWWLLGNYEDCCTIMFGYLGNDLWWGWILFLWVWLVGIIVCWLWNGILLQSYLKTSQKIPKHKNIIKKTQKIWKNYTKNQFPKQTGNFDKLILLFCLVVFILRWVLLLLLVLLLYVVLVYVVWVLIIRGCDWRGYR